MSDVPVRFSIAALEPLSVALSGEIDAHTAPELAEYFADLPAGDDDITLDLSAVEFMDSSGLRVILELHQRAQDGSRRLLLRTPSPAVARLFEIAGLQDHLHIVG